LGGQLGGQFGGQLGGQLGGQHLFTTEIVNKAKIGFCGILLENDEILSIRSII
jgi:hypothetical protein